MSVQISTIKHQRDTISLNSPHSYFDHKTVKMITKVKDKSQEFEKAIERYEGVQTDGGITSNCCIINCVKKKMEIYSIEKKDITTKHILDFLRRIGISKYYKHTNKIYRIITKKSLPKLTSIQKNKLRLSYESYIPDRKKKSIDIILKELLKKNKIPIFKENSTYM